MSYQLTKSNGSIEAVIDDNCGQKKFLSIAQMLAKELKIKFTGKKDGSENNDLFFKYKGHPLTLHFNMYNGVSIYPQTSRDNATVAELATFLERRFY